MTLAEISAVLVEFTAGVVAKPNIQWAIRSAGTRVQFFATNVRINITITYTKTTDDWSSTVNDNPVLTGILGPVLQATLTEAQAILQGAKTNSDEDIALLT